MPSPLIAYSLATVPDKIAELCGLEHAAEYEKKYQARPGQKLPIITLNDGVPEISEAWWGIRGNLSSAFLDMSRVLKTRPYNVLIRRQRCAVPANCFITWNNKNVHLVRLLQHRLFLMGGIWQEYKGERYFTLLETESADILSHVCSTMPVIFATEKTRRWLTADDVSYVMNFADRSSAHWFDYFRVSGKILDKRSNDRELLQPEGLSLEQIRQREKQLQALSFEKERMNRRNFKG